MRFCSDLRGCKRATKSKSWFVVPGYRKSGYRNQGTATYWFPCERNQRRRDLPSSLIRYSNVPRPRERRSNKPKLHSLFRYVHKDRAGEKSSLSAASFGPSHSFWVAANKSKTFSLSSLYRFILFPFRKVNNTSVIQKCPQPSN